MKFSMYDPETSVIGVSNTFGVDSSNNTRFYSRITSYSGKDAVHVLPEYDTIRDALGKCIEMGKSRGYAFVGAPGTGKTIMMNQLINEFPSAPVVKFSMQGFCDPVQPNQSSLLQSILDVVQSLSDAGFSKIFLCCDDIDSVDMSTKNLSVENLINLLDGLHSRLTNSTAIVFMCTVNDPTKMHSTIIKRGKRIDEVIEVPCPSEETIHRLINSLKDKEDPTDYTDPAFAQAITRMANDKFSLADLSTMMTTLQIYGAPDDSGKFTPETLETAISRIELSKANAAKTYEV
jgi:ATP-dependent 26S proteasome regulatory subunit